MRRFAVFASDDVEQHHTELDLFCHELPCRFGTIDSFVMTRAPLAATSAALLADTATRKIVVQGELDSPDRESAATFLGLLLGDAVLAQISQLVSDAEDAGEARLPLPLDAAALALATTVLAEVPIVRNELHLCTQVLSSGDGSRSLLTDGYALQVNAGDEGTCVLPLQHVLVSRCATVLHVLRRLRELPPSGGQQILIELAQALRNYYQQWIHGAMHVLDAGEVDQAMRAILTPQHVQLLTAHLQTDEPLTQLAMVDLLATLRAPVSDELLAIAADAPPVTQERCLRAIAKIGAPVDHARLEPFVRSPREAVRDRALQAVAVTAGPGADDVLIGFVHAGVVPLSRALVDALAATATMRALGWLLSVGAAQNIMELRFLIALERCIDATAHDEYVGPLEIHVPPKDVGAYIQRLTVADGRLSRRLGAKLITKLSLHDAVPLVEQLIRDGDLPTRFDAIRAVKDFREPRLVAAVADVSEASTDDTSAYTAWVTANMQVQNGQDGPAGWIPRVEDLNLVAAAQSVLDGVSTAPPPAEEEITAVWVRDHVEGDNAVFDCGSHLTVWVRGQMAVLVHDNEFGANLPLDAAKGMLSRGMTMTYGTWREIVDGIVTAARRGEPIRLPASPAMGETIEATSDDGGIRVTKGRRPTET